MKKKYDLFEKRIAVLNTRIERMNSAVVADNLILQKGTLFFHYLDNQWGWFMNSNGDKFEGKYFGEIVGLKHMEKELPLIQMDLNPVMEK